MGQSLKQDVTAIKGIGKETAANLATLGICTVEDLFNYLPYRYDDMRLRDLAEVNHEERVTVEGKVQSEPSLVFYAKKRSRLTFRLLVDRYLIRVTFFNRTYLKKQIKPQQTVTVTGKWDRHRQSITGNHITFGEHTETVDFLPVYRVKEKVTVRMLQRHMKQAFKEHGDQIVESLPLDIREKYKLISKKEALESLHFPSSDSELNQARRRMVYEEFLLFQLKMQAFRRIQREHSKGIKINYHIGQLKSFISTLPFQLTEAQKRVVNEICADLKSPYQMNRLLQGDVGSGKTVVAAIGLYACVTAGYQGALMVPTEILAEQHADSLSSLMQGTDLSIALLTSSVKGKKREEILKRLQSGEIDLIIGTHSLIQEEVNFHKLGFVITDEQHRFGVEQRRVLKEKGENPDVLFMTATPIPRTLAITVFGEMDVSTIDELPAGRKTIKTYWARHDMFERILIFMEKEMKKGRQVYVICPLIEESDQLDVQNAIDLFDSLTLHFQRRFKTGLMHGRLSAAEKEETMKAFSQNDIQLLVSTTVVEVGVNVPNATLMIIYDADRFGLSQLHQLRGRVGRGESQSYCILLADPKTEVGQERMRIMTETTDGFTLSERDLELRGPGDFFGKKQSGLPEFKVADMVHDYRALETARSDAAKLIESDEFWEGEEYSVLRNEVELSGATSGEKLD